MRANIRQIQKKRKFTEEFKRKIVKDFETGEFSVSELSTLHSIRNNVIYRWIYKFSTVNKRGYRVVELTESSDMKVKELQERIKELERKIGQKQIKIDFLEKMIDIAEEELNVDIKKNSNTQQSGGSAVTKKK